MVYLIFIELVKLIKHQKTFKIYSLVVDFLQVLCVHFQVCELVIAINISTNIVNMEERKKEETEAFLHLSC